MAEDIEIRIAKPSDAENLYKIYEYWNGSFIDGDENKRYFVLKNNFTLPQIQKIIEGGYATVAVEKNKCVSFYFINPFFDTGNLQERKDIINNLISKKVLPPGKFAFSLLSSTDVNYLGNGLNTKTLNLLREIMKDKYDYFVGVMNYSNTATHKSSLKMGWKHFGDTGFGLLAVTGTTEDRNDKLKL
ncbi:MAG TPA: hypothetical protein VIJ27_14000 [Mucilaginibacter sp.]